MYSNEIHLIDFNKKLNFFFDTKHIDKKNKINFKKELFKICKLPNQKFKESKSIKLNPFNKKKFKKKDFKFLKPIFDMYKFMKILKFKDYFKYFLIHGSFADNTYIKGWSDIDTFVVIKDNVLSSPLKMSKLRMKVKKLYNFFFKICPLQHHGLIIFTEKDLLNYSKNYLPFNALNKNINLLDNKTKLKINIQVGANQLLIKDIKNRLNLLYKAKKTGVYKHHPLKGKFLHFPIKKNSREMYQLFCHLGYINTLPAYYLSCINKSTNKADSFKLFNKIFKDKKIKNLIKKSEKVRSQWEKKQFNKIDSFIIPEWVTKILGSNYLKECIQIFEKIIVELESYNEKK